MNYSEPTKSFATILFCHKVRQRDSIHSIFAPINGVFGSTIKQRRKYEKNIDINYAG